MGGHEHCAVSKVTCVVSELPCKFLKIVNSSGTYIITSMYPPHSGAIGLSNYDWIKQPRALPHFTNGHLFCYSFFLAASVPQKENDIFITLPWLNNVG